MVTITWQLELNKGIIHFLLKKKHKRKLLQEYHLDISFKK